jgi:site-specific DNA recombinase
MTTKPQVRAALYCRISEDPSGKEAGVTRQRADCEAYAKRQGWTVVDVFTDNNRSAYNGKLRPEYQRLIDGIQAHAFDVVVGYHSSRWHRDVLEHLQFAELLKAARIAWHTTSEGEIKLDNASDEAMASVRAVFNRMESAIKSTRLKRQKLEAAQQGRHNGGVRCFGYEGDGMTVRESEAVEIRRLADAVIRGQSLRSLCLELNERGVKTVKGNPWSSAHLGRMLIRPRLVGVRAHKGKEYTAQWPPILDTATWEAVEAILMNPARRSGGGGRRGPTPTSLGTGIYRCGVCLEPKLRLGRGKARGRIYRCGNIDVSTTTGHVCRAADPLDAFIEGAVLELLSRPGAIEAMTAVIDAEDDGLEDLARERATIRPRLDNAATLFAAGDIDGDQFAIVSRTLNARDAEISAALAAASSRSAVDVFLDADDVERVWDQLSMGQRRAVLSELLVVTVLPAPGGGRVAGGGYFNEGAVRIELSEKARGRIEQ